MPSLSPSQAAALLNPFRRSRQCYEINPPDQVHNVVYLGNVLTIMAKGDQSIERPLQAIWRSYSTRKRDVAMKLSVTRQGLKVETKQLGITEYWAHRITYCFAPPEYPRVFCWVYKHEGKRMKPELRCHAVLCRKQNEPAKVVRTLTAYLQSALQEYKREKLAMEKARKSVTSGGELLPRRKLLLQTGTLNFRPPVNRSKSAPRLGSIDEEDEHEEDEDEHVDEQNASVSDYEFDEGSDVESFGYRCTPLLGGEGSSSVGAEDRLSTSSSNSSRSRRLEDDQANNFPRRQLSLSSASRRRLSRCLETVPSVDSQFEDGVVLEEDELLPSEAAQSSSASSVASSDDGFASSSSQPEFGFKADYPHAPQNSPNYNDKAKPSEPSLDSVVSSELQQLHSRAPKRVSSTESDVDGPLSDESGFHDLRSADLDEFIDGPANDPAQQIRRLLQQNCQVTAL